MWNLFPFDNYFLEVDRSYTIPAIWDLVKEKGYDKIYISINDNTWERALAIRGQRKRTGLGLAAVYTVLQMNQPNFGSEHNVSDLMDCLDTGDTLELAMSMGWEFDLSDPKHDDLALEILKPILETAKHRGIQISLYHHLGFWMERIEDCVRIAKKIDDTTLGVTFCGYHWYAIDGKDLIGKLQLATPYLKKVNLCGSRKKSKDSDFPLPYTIEPVGAGDFPLRDFLAGLKKIGYTGDVGFQGYMIRGIPTETLQQSIEKFRQAVHETITN